MTIAGNSQQSNIHARGRVKRGSGKRGTRWHGWKTRE